MLNAPIYLHRSHRLIHDSVQLMEKAATLLAQSRALAASGHSARLARARASLTSAGPVGACHLSASRHWGPMAPHTALTILIVDDEPSFASGLAQLLRHDGSTVDTVANGRLALEHLQAQRYDVVLCDLRMPELDGPDFYALLCQQHASLRQRVIFLTGDTLEAESTAFLAQCGQPWLSKPCHAAAIRRVMQQLLHAVEGTV
jgi:CheY-like chemotaxis protein